MGRELSHVRQLIIELAERAKDDDELRARLESDPEGVLAELLGSEADAEPVAWIPTPTLGCSPPVCPHTETDCPPTSPFVCSGS